MEIGKFVSGFTPNFLWGSTPADTQSPKEGERNWGDIACDVWGIAKGLFESFHNNFIVCYLSSHINEADKAIETTIPNIRTRWFDAENIPFSSRMNRDALIEGLKTQTKCEEIISTYFEGNPPEPISIEQFVNDHVMKLAEGETKKINNPTKYAFWLTRIDLKRSILTIEESVRKTLMQKLCREEKEIDEFVTYCAKHMDEFKAQLDLLLR